MVTLGNQHSEEMCTDNIETVNEKVSCVWWTGCWDDCPGCVNKFTPTCVGAG
jgi:hypothetical protein